MFKSYPSANCTGSVSLPFIPYNIVVAEDGSGIGMCDINEVDNGDGVVLRAEWYNVCGLKKASYVIRLSSYADIVCCEYYASENLLMLLLKMRDNGAYKIIPLDARALTEQEASLKHTEMLCSRAREMDNLHPLCAALVSRATVSESLMYDVIRNGHNYDSYSAVSTAILSQTGRLPDGHGLRIQLGHWLTNEHACGELDGILPVNVIEDVGRVGGATRVSPSR